MNTQGPETLLAAAAHAGETPQISSKLKSRIFSQIVKLEQAEGPLRILSENQALGDSLCIFEQIVAVLPSRDLQSRNPCRVCHARIAAEQVENALIFWPGCPYAKFCGH